MRQSVYRHVLAFLRKELCINQSDFAEVVGCSTPTVQAVELGRSKLSEPLAMKIFAATDANPRWLLANDLSAPHMHRRTGKPYTKAHFEAVQAKRFAPIIKDKEASDDELLAASAWQWSVLSAAVRQDQRKANVVLYRISNFREQLMEEFGLDFQVYNGKNLPQAVKLLEGKLAEYRQRSAGGT